MSAPATTQARIEPRSPYDPDTPDVPEYDSADLSHDALALDMGAQWSDARYVRQWGRWLLWCGAKWQRDETLVHMTRTREYLRGRAAMLETWAERKADAARAEGSKETLKEAEDVLKWAASQAARLRMAPTIAQVAELARSNPTQVATSEQWDADPMLLGTPAGTVDLRTGTLRPAKPTDYITMATAVAPGEEGAAPQRFLQVLNRITGGSTELQAYLQRFSGYALTGSVREHVLAFGYGSGANGKSLLVSVLQGILGDYAATIPADMLMVSQGDSHPTELARLRGVRLAVASETEEGRRFAEAKLKSLTGGDRIAARFMRQDFFEFSPAFKLLVVGNHRPVLRGVGEAMRRRLHMIPFSVTIPEGERDPDLPQKLRSEWPEVLRWMINGCLLWQRDGLQPPESVRVATDNYLEGEDALGMWLDSEATQDPDAWEPTAALFASWKRWAEAAGEFVGTQRRFSTSLQERGFTPHRQPGTGMRGYRGIRVQARDEGRRWEP